MWELGFVARRVNGIVFKINKPRLIFFGIDTVVKFLFESIESDADYFPTIVFLLSYSAILQAL
jgi:hypothetical protein